MQRFSDVAHRRGDAVAIVAGQDVITYRMLLKRASGIGAALRDRLGTRLGPVVLRLPAGVAAIEALLGVLYSGRSYLFLPPRTGPDALDDLLIAAIPSAQIVADDELPAARPSAGHEQWSTFTIGKLRSIDRSAEQTDSQAEPSDLACLFATSGTTGTPKLVGLSHRAVLFDVGRQTNDLYLGSDDRIDLLGHPSFSASLASIFTALLTGAELHILDMRHRFADLGAWLTQSGITISTMTVSTLRACRATLPPGGAPQACGWFRWAASHCSPRTSRHSAPRFPPRACCRMPWRPQKRGPMPSTSCREGPPRTVRSRSAGQCSPKTSRYLARTARRSSPVSRERSLFAAAIWPWGTSIALH